MPNFPLICSLFAHGWQYVQKLGTKCFVPCEGARIFASGFVHPLVLLLLVTLPLTVLGQQRQPYTHNRSQPPVLDAYQGSTISNQPAPNPASQVLHSMGSPAASKKATQFQTQGMAVGAHPIPAASSSPLGISSREEKNTQWLIQLESEYQKAEWELHRQRRQKGVSATRWRETAQDFILLRKRLSAVPHALANLQNPALFYAGFAYQQAFQQGSQNADRLRAVVAFRMMAKRAPLHPLADDSLLQVAYLEANQQNFMGAKRALETLLHNQPHGDQATIARSRLAALTQQLQRTSARRIQRKTPSQASPLRTYSANEFKKLEDSLVARVRNANKKVAPKPKPLLNALRLLPTKNGLRVLLAFKHARSALQIKRQHFQNALHLMLPKVRQSKRLRTSRIVAGGGLQSIRTIPYANKKGRGLRIEILLQKNTAVTAITQSPLNKEWGMIITLRHQPTTRQTNRRSFTPRPRHNQQKKPLKPPMGSRWETRNASKYRTQKSLKHTAKIPQQRGLEKSTWTPPPLPPWVVVIDPGHGGKDPGARSYGLQEKNLALQISLRLRNLIRTNAPHVRVVMTREDDRYISLEQRARLAQRYGANLFLSIHLNAHHARRLNGVETYTSSRKMSSGEQTKFKALAVRIHQGLLGVLNRGGRKVRDLGVKRAAFRVLAAGGVPAVLVEAGFLTNQREALRLSSPAHLQHIATGLYTGLKDYLQSLEHKALAKQYAPAIKPFASVKAKR